jgi:hypothetical protein
MLVIHDPSGPRLCDGLSRREWLRVGSPGGLSLSLAQLAQGRQQLAPRRPHEGSFGRARSCILLSLLGGPPQHETWDPKPGAPAEIRGELRPIRSATPGLLVGELMPRTARLTPHLCVLRAVCTNDNSHSSSGYYMATGQPHQPVGVENARPGAPNDWPCLGAVVRKIRRQAAALPAAITVPEQSANDGNLTWPGQDGGFLGRAADPWLINCDPSAPRFEVPGLTLPAEVSPLRLTGRRALLQQVNQHLDTVCRSGAPALHDARAEQAFDLIASDNGRQAFRLGQESAAVRDRYGRTRFGQSLLLARRLVEAGVALVRVNWTRVPGAFNNGHWDTHSNNTGGLRQLMPIMDQAYSALLEDLFSRGLLNETLVVWMGEFGRTPRLNGAGGRDHWGYVFSVALAGGGANGGRVVGASDRIGAYPRDGRVLPQDLTATIFHCLGYRPETEIHDNQGRPLPITRGEVIRVALG